VYSGTSLVADLKCQEFHGWYKKFTRKAPTDFELMTNLVSLKIVIRDTRFRAAILVQEKLAVTLQFWATGDSYTHLQYLSQISKQTARQNVTEVRQAIAKALTENTQVKNYVLHTAHSLAHKIDGLEQ